MRRKFLSVLLAMAMVLTLAPVTALAGTVTLEISPATGAELTEQAGTVSIAAKEDGEAAEGVAILYTTDADTNLASVTEASGNVEAYSAPINVYGMFTESVTSVTVKAVAVKDGVQVCSPVTATYTKKAEAQQPTTTTLSTVTVAITKPATGATPQATIAAGTGYTGTIAWTPAATDSKFAAEIEYTATVTLTAADGYAWQTAMQVSAITVTGATVTLDGEVTAGTLKFKAAFPATAAAETPSNKVATPTFSPAAGTYTSTQNVTISCATEDATIYYTTDGSAPTTSSTEYAAAISVSETKTIKAIAAKETMTNSEVASATYTINTGGSSSGSGSSSSGSSGGGSSSSTVTVPVSGDDKSVNVSANVSGSTAAIDKIDGLDKVIDSDVDTGVVEIDLTALKKDIDTVKVSTSALKDIAKAAADSDNDVDGLAIKLDSGTVTFDVDALEAIVDQATGSTIELVLEKTKSSDLNKSQKDAVKDMDIHGHFELKLTAGKAITSFKGGEASVRIPFSVPSGKDAANFVVLYVANDGSVEEMNTKYSNGFLSFTTGHFSKYVIAYKDSEPVEPEEPVDDTPVTADCDGGAGCPAGRFVDVDTNMWYHKALDYVITNGLMSGVGDSTFSPNANLSRAMLAQILYNQAGRPAVTGDSDFDDVAAGMWYSNAVAWATENGVVSGYGDGKFGPNDNITREQLAVMLYRYAGTPEADGSLDSFADAGNVSGYAQNALVWATGNGVMSGKGGGMLDPQGLATRAEVAQMLYNYLSK